MPPCGWCVVKLHEDCSCAHACELSNITPLRCCWCWCCSAASQSGVGSASHHMYLQALIHAPCLARQPDRARHGDRPQQLQMELLHSVAEPRPCSVAGAFFLVAAATPLLVAADRSDDHSGPQQSPEQSPKLRAPVANPHPSGKSFKAKQLHQQCPGNVELTGGYVQGREWDCCVHLCCTSAAGGLRAVTGKSREFN